MWLEEKVDLGTEDFAAIGLGLFMLVAGASKFIFLELWVGYDPRFISEIFLVTSRQLTLAGGVFEVVLGSMLLTRRKAFYAALTTSIWLSLINIQLLSLNMFDLAIRDFGLVLYAFTVTLLFK